MVNFYIQHNSQETYFRNPFGAVRIGTEVEISIEVEGECEALLEIVRFNGSTETINMFIDKRIEGSNIIVYKGLIDTSKEVGLINYYFKIVKDNQVFYYGNNKNHLGGIGEIYVENVPMYQLTVYEDNKIPSWYKDGIIYQIFVDRFFNGNEDGRVNNPKENSFIYGSWYDEPLYIKDEEGKVIRWDFFGGNLLGVKKKLQYIKSLGVSIIYFNPIFESSSCHKYDTGDYKKIDSMYGDEQIFKGLCKEANKLGIKIILDGVFSHTGADSKYFNKYLKYKSLGAYNSKESPYYSWYRFSEYPDKYDSWWGFENQPNVDELNQSYMKYVITDYDSVINKWMRLGVSGWRLDVADELPDEFIECFKKKMRNIKPESVLIGEVWEDASNKISYGNKRKYLFGDELDSPTNYPLRDILISFFNKELTSYDFRKKLMSLYENYPKEVFYSTMNVLGTHDTKRIFTALNENLKLLQLAIIFQMTFPGVPLIYYGDEAGLTGGSDPMNRKTYPWGKEKLEILTWYRRLTSIRNTHEIFTKGDFKIYNTDPEVICFIRNYKDKIALIALNRCRDRSILIEIGNISGRYKDILSKDAIYYSANGTLKIELKSYEGRVLLNM
ncbi:pullulanase [Clostridium cavendishii DSM 21758]|uniref:Pullulanase n=1 Tax=Clostridium cavendishii DSM 21758 TaxID=1121302 RepID=A0A1M6VGA3_9CLOT|nr:glycoside hydrolase family 13 protein [Clostridium cavendishii]SHK80385.1 pullulanase [Clostridium cavendishii DSM 21758]